MKTLFTAAIALAFATPAAAQPAQQNHGSHAHHGAQHHAGHNAPAQQHAQGHGAGHAQHGAAGDDHSQHKDCCGDANGNGKMDCCENMAAGATRPCCAKHQQQSGQAQPAPAKPHSH